MPGSGGGTSGSSSSPGTAAPGTSGSRPGPVARSLAFVALAVPLAAMNSATVMLPGIQVQLPAQVVVLTAWRRGGGAGARGGWRPRLCRECRTMPAACCCLLPAACCLLQSACRLLVCWCDGCCSSCCWIACPPALGRLRPPNCRLQAPMPLHPLPPPACPHLLAGQVRRHRRAGARRGVLHGALELAAGEAAGGPLRGQGGGRRGAALRERRLGACTSGIAARARP
jgi:hypothetical protein